MSVWNDIRKRGNGEATKKEDRALVEEFLESIVACGYTINPDNTVDVEGSVCIRDMEFPQGRLPVQFKTVGGDFSCTKTNITSCEGFPLEVKGTVYCGDNKLTTLKGCTQKIGKHFYCNFNQLTTLEGGPQEVGDLYNCEQNNLISLTGSPKHVKHFLCSYNKLSFLKGGPEIVEDTYFCDHNQLVSLEGCPKEVRSRFECSHNLITNHKDEPKITY